jgi:hypothetical protein
MVNRARFFYGTFTLLCGINLAYFMAVRYYVFGPIILVGAISLAMALVNVVLALTLAKHWTKARDLK